MRYLWYMEDIDKARVLSERNGRYGLNGAPAESKNKTQLTDIDRLCGLGLFARFSSHKSFPVPAGTQAFFPFSGCEYRSSLFRDDLRSSVSACRNLFQHGSPDAIQPANEGSFGSAEMPDVGMFLLS